MEEQKAKNMIKRLLKAGYKASLYENYSGRFMFGETTFGVVTDSDTNVNRPLKKDNLGKDFIYY